ncbi:transposase [Vannielia sp.]|uniref:REP-associated tyrosine transposase n=1 Tax=Vannielia sp. TaxID=2813045 RepID=UPI002621F051|nr:transposase [Vannielia sp.]MDF1871463.1 transposase [Vannielia sp.]
MPNYRRARVPGGTYFFTVALADRNRRDLVEHIDLLRQAYGEVARKRPFATEAIVILPDHLHAIWRLPEGDADFSTRWKEIKAGFSKRFGARRPRSGSKRAKGEVGVWQRRFWEHVIRDPADMAAHMAYCWGNPVKHGLVARPTDWEASSIHRDIRAGRVPPEWAVPEGAFGE